MNESVIALHHLSKSYGNVHAVEDLSLSIEAGTVFGFLGPNGAGKTTTVRMLAALISPTDGDAIVAGHTLGVDDTALRRVQVVQPRGRTFATSRGCTTWTRREPTR